MNVIVMGFTSQDRKADRVVLYAGADKVAADAALLAGAEGIVRTELYVNPQAHKRRSFSAAPVIVETPEATVNESLTVETQPEPASDPQASEAPEPLKLPKKPK
jgi:hypothetical protein